MMDFWQSAAALAGIIYTVGNIHQVLLTLKTRKTDGLSLPQWLMFSSASVALTAYYAHLDQWMMFSVSVIGTTCCAMLSILIVRFRSGGAVLFIPEPTDCGGYPNVWVGPVSKRQETD